MSQHYSPGFPGEPPLAITNPRHQQRWEAGPCPASAPSPHLLGGGCAQGGTDGVDGERGEGVDHQGQQDHEQDIGVGQGIPAGICQHSCDVWVGNMEREQGTSAGGQAPSQEGAEVSKEEMAPRLELKVKTAVQE